MTAKKTEAAELLEIRLKYLFEHGIDLISRRITLVNEVDVDMFSALDAGLSELERINNQAVTIRINSTGGDEYEALAIVGRLKSSKCRIITEGYGSIMSSATLILACGWKRRISRFASFMHHESFHEITGRTSHLSHELRQLEKLEILWAGWMAEMSTKPADFYLKQGKNTDKYWTPEQLVEFGIVDEVI